MTSLYDFIVPTYTHALTVLEHILDKGEAYCKEHNISEADILAWRFSEDMLPFPNQIQIICNGAKNSLVRVAGLTDLPVVEDNEKTLSELRARIAKTKTFFEGVTPAQFEGKETAEVVIPARNGPDRKFDGLTYVRNWALPNLHFHLTTVYLMFRSHGAPVGKMDYLKGASA